MIVDVVDSASESEFDEPTNETVSGQRTVVIALSKNSLYLQSAVDAAAEELVNDFDNVEDDNDD